MSKNKPPVDSIDNNHIAISNHNRSIPYEVRMKGRTDNRELVKMTINGKETLIFIKKGHNKNEVQKFYENIYSIKHLPSEVHDIPGKQFIEAAE